MKIRVLITLASLLLLSSPSAAQDSFDFSDETESNPEKNLPNCDKADQSVCKESCHGEFDQKFHSCIQTCLEKRCIAATQTFEKAHQSEEAAGYFCLQTQSEPCTARCKLSNSSASARCRRACLLSRCPESDPMQVAEESLNPGQLACTRCKSEFERSCARQCSAGTWRSNLPGLAQFGCEKACMMGSCSKSCGMQLP